MVHAHHLKMMIPCWCGILNSTGFQVFQLTRTTWETSASIYRWSWPCETFPTRRWCRVGRWSMARPELHWCTCTGFDYPKREYLKLAWNLKWTHWKRFLLDSWKPSFYIIFRFHLSFEGCKYVAFLMFSPVLATFNFLNVCLGLMFQGLGGGCCWDVTPSFFQPPSFQPAGHGWVLASSAHGTSFAGGLELGDGSSLGTELKSLRQKIPEKPTPSPRNNAY